MPKVKSLEAGGFDANSCVKKGFSCLSEIRLVSDLHQTPFFFMKVNQ